MGDVIPLATRCCPCGWEAPTAIRIRIREPIRGPYSVEMDCPKCGRVNDTRTVRDEPDTALADVEAMRAVCDAAKRALIDNGPSCIVCAEDLVSDLDACEPGCSGHALRKAVVALDARRKEPTR